jgi:hypothetical protein
MHILSPYLLYSLPIASLIWSLKYLGKSKNYMAAHYAVLCNPPLLLEPRYQRRSSDQTMVCVTNELWFNFKQGETDLSPFPSVQTGPGVHVGIYSKSTAGSFGNCVVIICGYHKMLFYLWLV